MEIRRHHATKILSEAVEYASTIVLAGLVADDLSQDVKGQTAQVLKKIDHLLAAAGSDKSKLLCAQIWLNDIRHRAAMNEAWLGWVDQKNLPARACVEAKMAEPTCLVEIMVTAAK
jgi:enamine deaminase RidA (YjgF/YER057c/UK114 family)